MAQYVVIGTSPLNDTSVATGPYRSHIRAVDIAVEELEPKGWVTEIVELMHPSDIGSVLDEEDD